MRRSEIHPSITEDRVIAACMRRLHSLDNPGLCLHCGASVEGVEPDAARYLCEHCRTRFVFGSDQILQEGLYHHETKVERKLTRRRNNGKERR